MPDFDLDSALSVPNACPSCGNVHDFRKFVGGHVLDIRHLDDKPEGRVSPVARRRCLNPDCGVALALEYAPEWSSLAEEQNLPLERCTKVECPNCSRLSHVEVRLSERGFILPRAMLCFDCWRCGAGWATRYKPSHFRQLG